MWTTNSRCQNCNESASDDEMEDVGVMQQNIPLIEILEPTLQSGLEVKRGDRDNPTSYQPPYQLTKLAEFHLAR